MNNLLWVSLLLCLSFNGIDGQSCRCGIEKTGSRIIGGTAAKANRYPWMTGVLTGNALCGGSLINDRYVLTAAHCVTKGVMPKIVLGGHTMADLQYLQGVQVSDVIIHATYKPNQVTSQGDVALVKLARPVTFTDKVSPICLGTAAQMNPNNLFVTGWGKTLPQDRRDNLNEVSLPPMSNSECSRAMGTNTTLQICAGIRGKSACQGDSGGPLSTRDTGRIFQVGVVSWGRNDCGVNTGAPGVFSRVQAYVPWIQANTRDAKYCG